MRGYERAKTEETVHYKQKNYRKYERMFESYAYPINLTKFTEQDMSSVKAIVEEENN